MGIKIKNLRVSPYSQKDDVKVIFGDELKLSFEIAHVDGESYLCALDNERILYPVNRPVCAYSEVFTRDGDDVNFTLKLNTSKLRDYVSSIRKPMPVYLQIVRVVNGKYETVLLDDILAIPSVIDGSMTVYEGDPLRNLIDGKMDIPEQEGTAGQVLTLDEDGNWTWQDPQGGGDENVQSDWDCSDSESDAFIKNKPQLATVATSGSYNDLTDKPIIPEQAQADWDESDSEAKSYIKNKPSIPTVNDGKITVNQGGVKKGEFTVNQSGDTVIDLNDGAQSDWDESDSSNVSFIKNKPNLATVSTSGSYNDLTNKPDLTVYAEKSELPPDDTDYLCFTAEQANSTVRLSTLGSPSAISLEYSNDKSTWTPYTVGNTITLTSVGEKVYFRGDNATFSTAGGDFYKFNMTGKIGASGNLMSLLSKDCSKTAVPDFGFTQLFVGCGASLTSIPSLDGIKSCGNAALMGMFYNGLTGLTSVVIPAIAGTNLWFCGFYGCSNLARVEVKFHEWNIGNASQWLDGVAANGTFVCPADLDCSTRSVHRVPSGWTIVRTEAVTPDWDTSDSTDPAFIKHKPTIPDAQVQADWDESDSSATDFIKGKPVLATVATSGSYNDLSNKPTIDDDRDYLCFTVAESLGNNGIAFAKSGTLNDLSLEYSFDKVTWNTVPNFQYISGSNVAGRKIYIRGDNTTVSVDSSNYLQTYINCKMYVTGNIMSLLSKDCSKTSVPAYCFYKLFNGCSNLLSAPKLPATTLGTSCYESLFQGCSALKEAPELPATVLAQTCYKAMFKNCSKLKKAPVLPATVMVTQCYVDMFGACSSLTEAPELPATTLATECYGGMFGDCTGLTSLPSNYLPATTLAQECYQWMFYGCTGLKFACNLPATTLAQACYSWMYGACTGLLDSGNISASVLAGAGMEHMFDSCTSLCRVKIPNMTTWNTSCTSEWLKGLNWYQRAFVCHASLDTTSRSISTIPQGWIACRSAYGADGLVNMWTLNNTNFTLAPCTTEQDKITITENGLTLNAIALPNGYVGSAHLYIYWYSTVNATITAGTGIEFVDTPRKGYLSHCIVTWEPNVSTAKLRVMWETAL